MEGKKEEEQHHIFDLGGGDHLEEHTVPLLLLHANGFHHAVFEPLAACLRGSRFRCYALDLPGHGDAAHLTPALRPAADAVASAARLLAAKHGGAPAVALGHSLGGALALLAEEGCPGTFAAVYAFEPVAGPSADAATVPAAGGGADGDDELSASRAAALASMARRRRAAFASHEEAGRRLGSKPPFGGFHPAALRAYLRHGLRWEGGDTARVGGGSGGGGGSGSVGGSGGGVGGGGSGGGSGGAGAWVLRCTPDAEAGWFEAVGRFAPLDAARVACPVRVAVGGSAPTSGGGGSKGSQAAASGSGSGSGGGGDDIHSGLRSLGARLSESLPRASLRRFPALSHFGPLEAPAEVAADALAFFEGALAAGAVAGPRRPPPVQSSRL